MGQESSALNVKCGKKTTSKKYRKFITKHKEAVCVCSGSSGTFLMMNEPFARLFKYNDSKEMIEEGSHLGVLSPPFQKDGSMSQDVAQQKVATCLETENGIYEFDWEFVDAESEPYDAHVWLSVIMHEEGFDIQAVVRNTAGIKGNVKSGLDKSLIESHYIEGTFDDAASETSSVNSDMSAPPGPGGIVYEASKDVDNQSDISDHPSISSDFMSLKQALGTPIPSETRLKPQLEGNSDHASDEGMPDVVGVRNPETSSASSRHDRHDPISPVEVEVERVDSDHGDKISTPSSPQPAREPSISIPSTGIPSLSAPHPSLITGETMLGMGMMIPDGNLMGMPRMNVTVDQLQLQFDASIDRLKRLLPLVEDSDVAEGMQKCIGKVQTLHDVSVRELQENLSKSESRRNAEYEQWKTIIEHSQQEAENHGKRIEKHMRKWKEDNQVLYKKASQWDSVMKACRRAEKEVIEVQKSLKKKSKEKKEKEKEKEEKEEVVPSADMEGMFLI